MKTDAGPVGVKTGAGPAGAVVRMGRSGPGSNGAVTGLIDTIAVRSILCGSDTNGAET